MTLACGNVNWELHLIVSVSCCMSSINMLSLRFRSGIAVAASDVGRGRHRSIQPYARKKPLVLRVETLGKSWNLRTWFSRHGKSWNLKMKMWKCRKWTLNSNSWKTGKIFGKSRGKSWNLENVKDYEPLTTSSVSAFLRNLYFSDYLANKSKQLP